MKHLRLIAFSLLASAAIGWTTLNQINEGYECPLCLDNNCIYQEIDSKMGEGTDSEVLKAIYEVCERRGIKDTASINLLKLEYYVQ